MSIHNSSSPLTAIAEWAVSLMDFIGPAGAGVAVALENLFPPIPSEVILPLAGMTASMGSFTVAEAIVWTTAGSVIGALILYGLGAWLGVNRLRVIAAKLPLMDPQDVNKTVGWFHKHGYKAVFFGRLLPIFRSLISIPAGVARMPLWQFGALTAAGSLIWNSVLVLAGSYLGENWGIVERYTDLLQWIVLAAIALGVLWFVYTRLKSKKNKESS